MDRPPAEERRFRSDLRQSKRDRGLAVYAAAVAVVAGPLLVGGGPLWAQLTSAAVAFAVALFFVATRRFAARLVPFALPAAVAVVATSFQLLPLPAFLIRWLSPRAYEVRSEAAGAAPSFLPITLDVPATLLEVSKGLACLALLLVVGTAARRASRARPLIYTLAFLGALIGGIHVVQRLLDVQGILGLYQVRDMPGTGLWGTFVNGNQAASVLALSALVAAGLAIESAGLLRLCAIGSVMLSMGVLATTSSRAGVLGLVAGTFVFTALMAARRFGTVRALLIASGLVVALAASAVGFSSGLRTRLAASSATNPASDQKIRGWQDTLRVIEGYPWTGVGRGAFEAPTTAFRKEVEGVRLVFPENVILQITAEWGLPIALALLVLFGLQARKLVPVIPRLEPTVQATACGVLAVLVHELADFGLELPGVAFPTVAAVGLVVARVQELDDPSRRHSPRLGPAWVVPGLALWGVALAGGLFWALPRGLWTESQRLRAAVGDRSVKRDELLAAIRRHPADYYLELLAANDAIRRRDPIAGKHLNRAQRLNPAEPAVHLATARWLASVNRRSQAAIEYRLAADHGWQPHHPEILDALGDKYLADAVPQTATALMDAARTLLGRRNLRAAVEVSARAVEAGNNAEELLARRVALAQDAHAPQFLTEAARALLAAANHPESFAVAAEALGEAKHPTESDAAIEQGLIAHPRHSGLLIAGARLRLERDDLTGALGILLRGRDGVHSLADRLAMEELRAVIADKRGDVATATSIRAHARMLARRSAEALAPP